MTIGSQPPTLLAFVPGSTIDARQRVELCEGLVRLAIRQNDAFTKQPPSPWIEFGIAGYLASMSTLDREGVDSPGFRFFDEQRVTAGAEDSIDSLFWPETDIEGARLYPLQVLAHATESSWNRALDPGDDLRPSERRDELRNLSYALVTYFDLAFQRFDRGIFDRILTHEAAGKRGLESIAFLEATDRKRIPLQLFAYMKRPGYMIQQAVQRGAALDAWVAEYTGGLAFELPGASTSKDTFALPKPVRTPELEAILTIVGLRHGNLQHEIGERQDAGARAATTMRSLVDGLHAASTAGKNLRLPLWEDGRYRMFSLLAASSAERFVVERKGAEAREVAWHEIPPHFLAEAAINAKLVSSKDSVREGVEAMLAIFAVGRDESEIKRVLSRAKKSGFEPADLPRDVDGVFDAVERVDAFCRAVPGGLDAAWKSFSTWLAATQQGSLSRQYVALRASRILDAAAPYAWRSTVRARVEDVEPRGDAIPKVKLTYDWKSKEQLDDWVPMQAKDGFAPTAGYKAQLATIDTAKGCIRASEPCAMRHRIPFGGNVAVTFRYVVIKKTKETQQGLVEMQSYEPYGTLLVGARRPAWYAALEMDAVEVTTFGQVRRQPFSVEIGRLFDEGIEQGAMTLRRIGDEVEVLFPSGKRLLAMPCKGLAREGAVVWVNPYAGKVASGEITITGTVSLETARRLGHERLVAMSERLRALR